jgi:hypothetical protein
VKLAGVPLNSAFVVKYSPADGLPQWARTLSNIYSTHGNGIAVDSNANVYVAGTYALAENLVLDENVPSVYLKPTTSYAAFVIKYSVDGVPLWANQIDASGSDNTNAIAVDASGNVYAGGYYTADNDVILDANVPSVILKATSGTTNNAAFLVKYNTSGVPQWAVQRDTIVDGHYGISVDASGNAYVTGYYNSTTDVTLAPGVVLKASNGDTACTVKYSSSGVPLWANVIDGNDREYGIGISADTYGNVYVAGTYKSDVAITLNTTKGVVLNKTDGGWKTFLVKYAQGYPDYKLISDPYIANGSIKLLVNASAAPATVSVRNAANTATLKTITVNGDDVKTLTWYGNTYYGSQSATSTLTVDDSDSTMLSTRHNVSVLKNTTASISAAWARKIDGAGSDVGKGVAVDAYGNVYATGHYTAALTVDVVAGVTLDAPLGTEAAYIIKYNQDGTALWAKKIDGEGNEAGLGVAVDASGNVYVTGRYNTTGITVAPGLTLDAPLGTHAVFIIKYNSLGTALWAKQIDGTGLDIGYGIAVDAPGNVYVTGYYDGAAITVDAVAGVALDAPLGAAATFLVKYNTFGTALWAKTIDGAGTDVGHGVAVDAHGNVYVTGYINASIIVSPTITLDAPIAVLAAFVIKYNTVGTALWANKIDDGGASHGYGIAVDAPGNVYVTGYYNSQSIAVSPTITLDAPINGTYAVYIVKYNTLGIAQWAKTIDGAGNDQGLGVAVDGSGNVYVTGFYDGRITVALGITLDAPIASLGAFIVKYNTFGTALWAKQIDGGGTDVGHGIAVDVSGNVYATGYYLNAGITVDSVTGVALGAPLGADAAFLVKYTPFTPYRLISDASITNGLHKLVVNSSPYQATVHVRNATNTSTIDTLTIAAGATKALTWYGTQFYQI